MSPAPVGAAPAPTPITAAAAPKPAAGPAPSVPSAAGAGAAAGSAKPPTAGLPSGDAAAAAKDLVGNIKTLATSTQGIDTTWANSAMQAKSAVESLGKDAKLPEDVQGSLTRIMFIGKVMDMRVPKDFKPTPADTKLTPAQVITGAEKAIHEQVGRVAKQSIEVMNKVPDGAPKELTNLLGAIKEHVSDALYAIKFSRHFAPPPAPPAQQGGGAAPANGAAPAAKPAQGGGSAAATGGATPAAAPAAPSAPAAGAVAGAAAAAAASAPK